MNKSKIIKNVKPIKFGGQIGMALNELDRKIVSKAPKKTGRRKELPI